MTGNGLWHARTVSKLLSNEVYTGKLVQGKTKIANKMQQVVSHHNLIEVENAHEAIISEKLFNKVQEILDSKNRTRNTRNRNLSEPYSLNLFAGRIFCAHCSRPLNRKKKP